MTAFVPLDCSLWDGSNFAAAFIDEQGSRESINFLTGDFAVELQLFGGTTKELRFALRFGESVEPPLVCSLVISQRLDDWLAGAFEFVHGYAFASELGDNFTHRF